MITETKIVHELTPTQQAMLMYSLYAPQSKAYFEQVCFSYRGPMDVAAFKESWRRVIQRHEILRTSFVSNDGERFSQFVHDDPELDFQTLDWSDLSSSEQQRQRNEFLKSDCERRFDLAVAPLLRIAVLRTGEEAFWIVISNHHIILDGWSMSLVRKEVSRCYQHLVHDRATTLTEPIEFASYLQWLKGHDQQRAEKFWRRELEGFAAPNDLPVDHGAGAPAVGLIGDPFAEKEVRLSKELTAAIRDCARRHHVTISTVLQGAWAVLLGRYSASADVVFGITVSGRPYDLPAVESLVGLLINTLPVRVALDADDSVETYLKKIQRRVSGALEYEHCSLKEVQQWSGVPFNVPLFDTLLVFENFAGSGSSLDLDGPVEVTSTHLSRTNYPLTLVVNPGAEMSLQIVYHERRFDGDAIERMLAHLANLLEGMAASTQQQVRDLPMLSVEEKQKLLVELNDTYQQFQACDTVVRLFERQVQLAPDAVALIEEEKRLTYSELNARANQLAAQLKKLGVGAETRVGICIPRSREMLIAVLAVLKAGGAYVPMDPTYPADRLALMSSDGGIAVLLTLERTAQRLPDFAGQCLCLDAARELIEGNSAANLPTQPNAGDAAYVIYTSGSTGKPKGTVVEHGSLINFTQAATRSYEIVSTDRVLQFASLSFDTSAEEIFCALTNGAALVLRTDSMISSAAHFLKSCGEFGITVLDLPTAYWHELTDDLVIDQLTVPECVRLVILGGEKALSERLVAWRQSVGDRVRLINTYGPTEATIVTTLCELSEPQSGAPIGRPIANALLYVLDSERRLVPFGLPGELYIGGAGVARGYLNRPELTEEKFVPNPFADKRAPRLYRSGDLVRYRPDGNLEFLGRSDNQVKIRGFRVELEEIEQAIRQHDHVREAVVLAAEDGSEKKLIAYVVSAREAELTTAALREFLLSRLPGYMVPLAIVLIDAIPLLPNGKTDRRALLNLKHFPTNAAENSEAPRGPLEKSIAEIWAAVLKLDNPGIHENFFELGGHSLLAAKLISNLRRQLHIEISLIDVFQAPTIAKLAALICERQAGNEAEEDLASLLAEIESMTDEQAEQRLTQEISKGGLRAQALKVALLTTGALQILSDVL